LDLDLIRQKSETKGYYFNVDGKRKVTKEVFMYGLLKLKEKNKDNTIAYETIHDQLGLLFCMNDTETITMLKSLSHIYSKQMTYSDVSGIRQVQFIDELNPTTVLEDYSTSCFTGIVLQPYYRSYWFFAGIYTVLCAY